MICVGGLNSMAAGTVGSISPSGSIHIADGQVIDFAGAGIISIGTSGGTFNLQRAAVTFFRYNPGVDFQWTGAPLTSNQGSGSVAFQCNTAGARIKFSSGGTTDYLSSDGSTSISAAGNIGVSAGARLFFAGSSVGFVNNGTRTLMEGAKSTVAVGSQSTDEATLGGPMNVNVTPVASSGAGTNLISYTLPANALNNVGRGLKITAWGHVANNANAKTVSLAFGSQTIVTKQLTVSIAIEVWKLTAIVVRTGASTQQIFAEAWNEAGTTVSSVDGPTTLYQATQTNGTQTETATIVIKGVATTATTTDITQDGMIVEYF